MNMSHFQKFHSYDKVSNKINSSLKSSNHLKVWEKGAMEDAVQSAAGIKRCLDSEHLIGLEPSELVMVDLPSKGNRIHQWLPKILGLGNARYVEANCIALVSGANLHSLIYRRYC
jgi:hypothetical protein